jgi:hypothetical protein
MSAKEVLSQVKHNDASMSGHLPSTQEMKAYDHCCGIHGAARERKGIKKGTASARRRHDKAVIRDSQDE